MNDLKLSRQLLTWFVFFLKKKTKSIFSKMRWNFSFGFFLNHIYMIWKAQICRLFENSRTPHTDIRAKQIMTPRNLTRIPWKHKESQWDKWFYSRETITFIVQKHHIPVPIDKIHSGKRWEPKKAIFWTKNLSFGLGGVSNWQHSFKRGNAGEDSRTVVLRWY